MRKLVLFGNGLGRSLDNEFFQLERALSSSWNDPSILTDEQRTLILQCLPEDVLEDETSRFPREEAELDRLQRVLAACDEISKHETEDGVSWLTDDGKLFPFAIRSFIHKAASFFHSGSYELPSTFVDPLIEWLLATRSHIATLNYDELLYRAFVNTEVFSGYSCLLDGFVPTFDPSNLDRWQPAQQSYYLHLHGSPLYFNSQNNELCKSNLSQLPMIEGYSSTHLVLTHVDHKSAVISASPILREYWKRLETAMTEAQSIILFGYGGGDKHLNLLISKYFREKQVEVVERRKPEYNEQAGVNIRCQHWQNTLGVEKVVCFWFENILEHRNWTWVDEAQ